MMYRHRNNEIDNRINVSKIANIIRTIGDNYAMGSWMAKVRISCIRWGLKTIRDLRYKWVTTLSVFSLCVHSKLFKVLKLRIDSF